MYTKEFKEAMGRGSDGLDHRRLVIPEKSPIHGQNASLLSSPLFQSRPVEWASDLMVLDYYMENYQLQRSDRPGVTVAERAQCTKPDQVKTQCVTGVTGSSVFE